LLAAGHVVRESVSEIGHVDVGQRRERVAARRVDALLIVVPLAAMLVAGLFSRSRLPSERPAD